MAAATPSPALSYWERNPPYAVIAAGSMTSSPIQASADPKATKETPITLKLQSGDALVGVPQILRYIARAGQNWPGVLYGADALEACQVDTWLELAPHIQSGAGLDAACASLNDFLALRTLLVGHSVTIADLAIWGQLQGAPMWRKVRAGNKVPHLARWFDFVSCQPDVAAAVEQLDAAVTKRPGAATTSAAAGSAGAAGGGAAANNNAGGNFDIDLPGAEMGKVVTRFPPEPSGYLHIGHAKAALLNQYFADLYKGKLIVRFDDTNPSKEKDEFVENILADIAGLGLRYDRITYTSDYFPQLLDMGERLIKAGLMYADDTPVEQMREERMVGTESKHRNRPIEESLRVFEDMKAGRPEGLATAMRFKIDMANPNKALRDPVAYRCNLTPHHRTGVKYKVYPTYDCACPFVDAVEGVTHALRTSEYRDREAQYYWVLAAMQKVWQGLPKVHIWDYSRLNFVHTLLSKRKLTWFVDQGIVSGWTDPRMPTVQGILRRGLRMEALREFILSQGASKNMTVQEWDKIWTINKRLIDPVVPRHTAVVQEGRVPVTLTNGPAEPEVVTVPKHKKYAPAGKKALVRGARLLIDQADAAVLSVGEEVTLMDWGNAIVKAIHRGEGEGAAITGVDAELHLEGDFKTTKLKLTWLTESDELVPLLLADLDHLITKRKLEEEDDFTAFINPKSRVDTVALGDINMRSLQKGDVLQLERKGYYIVDEPLVKPGKPIVLFNIPDGRLVKK